MLSAVAQPPVLRRSPKVDFIAALVDELVAEVSRHGHAVPQAELGAESIEQVGAVAMALAAQNLMLCRYHGIGSIEASGGRRRNVQFGFRMSNRKYLLCVTHPLY